MNGYLWLVLTFFLSFFFLFVIHLPTIWAFVPINMAKQKDVDSEFSNKKNEYWSCDKHVTHTLMETLEKET